MESVRQFVQVSIIEQHRKRGVHFPGSVNTICSVFVGLVSYSIVNGVAHLQNIMSIVNFSFQLAVRRFLERTRLV